MFLSKKEYFLNLPESRYRQSSTYVVFWDWQNRVSRKPCYLENVLLENRVTGGLPVVAPNFSQLRLQILGTYLFFRFWKLCNIWTRLDKLDMYLTFDFFWEKIEKKNPLIKCCETICFPKGLENTLFNHQHYLNLIGNHV